MIEYKGEDFRTVVESSKLVLIDFFATWCGPCQMIMPVLDEVAKEEKDVKIYKVDVDQHRQLAIDHQVRGVPTLVLYKDGKVVDQASGYRPKAKIVEWINSHK